MSLAANPSKWQLFSFVTTFNTCFFDLFFDEPKGQRLSLPKKLLFWLQHLCELLDVKLREDICCNHCEENLASCIYVQACFNNRSVQRYELFI